MSCFKNFSDFLDHAIPMIAAILWGGGTFTVFLIVLLPTQIRTVAINVFGTILALVLCCVIYKIIEKLINVANDPKNRPE